MGNFEKKPFYHNWNYIQYTIYQQAQNVLWNGQALAHYYQVKLVMQVKQCTQHNGQGWNHSYILNFKVITSTIFEKNHVP